MAGQVTPHNMSDEEKVQAVIKEVLTTEGSYIHDLMRLQGKLQHADQNPDPNIKEAVLKFPNREALRSAIRDYVYLLAEKIADICQTPNMSANIIETLLYQSIAIAKPFVGESMISYDASTKTISVACTIDFKDVKTEEVAARVTEFFNSPEYYAAADRLFDLSSQFLAHLEKYPAGPKQAESKEPDSIQSLAVMPVQRGPRIKLFGVEVIKASKKLNSKIQKCGETLLTAGDKLSTKANMRLFVDQVGDGGYTSVIEALAANKELSYLSISLKQARKIVETFAKNGKVISPDAADKISEQYLAILQAAKPFRVDDAGRTETPKEAFARYIVENLEAQSLTSKRKSTDTASSISSKSTGSNTSSIIGRMFKRMAGSENDADLKQAAKNLAAALGYVNFIVEHTAKPKVLLGRAGGNRKLSVDNNSATDGKTMQELAVQKENVAQLQSIQAEITGLIAMANSVNLTNAIVTKSMIEVNGVLAGIKISVDSVPNIVAQIQTIDPNFSRPEAKDVGQLIKDLKKYTGYRLPQWIKGQISGTDETSIKVKEDLKRKIDDHFGRSNV